MKQNCCSIPGWIKPILAANAAFAFARLYFQTWVRWELWNGAQRSFDGENKWYYKMYQVCSSLCYDNKLCFCRTRIYRLMSCPWKFHVLKQTFIFFSFQGCQLTPNPRENNIYQAGEISVNIEPRKAGNYNYNFTSLLLVPFLTSS